MYQTNLDLRQLENLWECVDAVGVGGESVQTLAAEDGGGHRPQPVAAQVQLLQLLQPCQFTAGRGRYGYITTLPLQTLFLGATFIKLISPVSASRFWSEAQNLAWIIMSCVCRIRTTHQSKGM